MIQSIRNISFSRIQAVFAEFFGLSRMVAIIVFFLISMAMLFAVFWFFHSAPPSTIIITSGPEGSVFRNNAEKFAKILARNGVKLKILPSEGSIENLKRLADPSFRVDIGFVQGGVTGGMKIDKLVSLGSISYQPLFIFYRSAAPVDVLSELNGKRLAIGQTGSGTQTLSLALLAANGIEPGGETTLTDLDADDAAKALLEGKVDAVFLMGDSASVQNMRTLLRTPGIHLMDFSQAEGYTRKITYLNKLVLPKGSIDFGKDIPAHDVHLIGPTVEIIARPDLHPALSDLLIEAAHEIHSSAGLLKRKDEFPTPLSHEFAISDDATRYYKSGKSFLYRSFPFWMASLVNRVLVVFVPMIVLLIPGLRMIPAIYRWRISMGIYRWYRALLALEQELLTRVEPEKRQELLLRLDQIERAVNNMKVPASFAEQFYVLRGHIGFVRTRLMNHAALQQADGNVL
jgi:TRAP-type uncharacterized transport system substrate-binding protein